MSIPEVNNPPIIIPNPRCGDVLPNLETAAGTPLLEPDPRLWRCRRLRRPAHRGPWPGDRLAGRPVLFDRSGWFKVVLKINDLVEVEFGDGSIRRFGPIQNSVKTNLIINLVNQAAVATGTADTNVATLLIDEDADWYTNGIIGTGFVEVV